MNDLDLCLELVYGHVNHCVTFAVETTASRKWPMEKSNGHVTDDVTWRLVTHWLCTLKLVWLTGRSAS